MPRKLKTYQTSIGFYDLAIAAPSMKAALEAWGAGSNLFHQGAARETDDPAVVDAAMAKPGVVLKRPAGSNGRFAEDAELPDVEAETRGAKKRRPPASRKRPAAAISDKHARQAAAAFERQQKQRDARHRKEEALREKERARREKLVAKAQTQLDAAEREHDEHVQTLEHERDAIDQRIEAATARWRKEKDRLTKALRRAKG